MGIYRKGKFFWFTKTINGKRIQQSIGTDNKRLAEKAYAKILTEMVEDRYFDTLKAKRLTFSEMVEKYMQKYQKHRDPYTIKHLLAEFGNLTLYDITTEMISDYKERRLQIVRPATVYQELALMRRMFNVARKEWKWIKYNPVADLSFSVGNSNARDRWLTVEEEKNLLSSASPEWIKKIIVFAVHTGMRRGEILNLVWMDVDFKRQLILVQKSKNDEKRTIPMSQTLYEMLKNQKIRDISGRIFPVKVMTLEMAFSRSVKRAKIENLKFHDLRHTFATRLIQNGIDLYKVKELLGHKSISMTMRYAHHCPDSLRDSVKVLDTCYNSATVEVINER